MSYRCPNCGMVSHNPTDEAQQYCGACHRFADEIETAEQRLRRHELLEQHAQRMAARTGDEDPGR